MSKYYNFEDFMQSVINEADQKCIRRYSKSLSDAYDVNASIIKMIKALIEHGWTLFIAIASLLILGPIAFGAACLTFASTPIGIVAIGVLAVFGGVSALRALYRNKVLPLSVKETGEKYKSEFNNHKGEEIFINSLIDRASDYLVNRATKLL